VFTWPDAQSVEKAIRRWAGEIIDKFNNIVRLGYFGSYARGDWGVGSDLDLVIVVDESPVPFMERGVKFDTTGLPVPADLLVYTVQEWHALPRTSPRFADSLAREAVWVYCA
jgi:predicted nucleotidyltransferase